MKTRSVNAPSVFRPLLPLLVIAAAACDTDSPTQPDLDSAALSASDELMLTVLASPDAVEAGLAVAEAPVVVAEEDAGPTASGRPALVQARRRFEEARGALASGDHVRALSRAYEAQDLLATALRTAGGDAAVVAVVERAEALAAGFPIETDDFHDPSAVTEDLTELAGLARMRLAAGDHRGAMRAAVTAEQTRHLRRRQAPDRDRVDLALALGETAIDLATRLLPDTPAPAQLRFLRAAERHLRAAEAFDDAGQPGRAVHSAELAVWNALKAVVAPGGVTEEEQRLILDLARELLAAAKASAPQGTKAALLELAGRLATLGLEQLESGNARGVAPLWGSAVISSWLIS